MKAQVYLSVLVALLSVAFTAELHAQSTTFSYQGHLAENGVPFTGSAEFQFTLWDAVSGGTAVATNNAEPVVIPVTNGLFTVALDFGGPVFDSTERFLQIEVRTTIGPFATLSPRQRIMPAPQAIHATMADTAAAAMMMDMGTISNPTFVGTTTTNAPLELFVNNQRVMRFEDNGDGSNGDSISDGAPNVIGGSAGNYVSAGVVGATIAGGGSTNQDVFPLTNAVLADYGCVLGGQGNLASGSYSTVGGGKQNTAADVNSTVGGGGVNTAGKYSDTVAGGIGNTANGVQSTVGGGADNMANGLSATVPGGFENVAAGYVSLAAGQRAKANHDGTFVWADSQNSDFASTANDQFSVRAASGVRIHNQGSGATLLRLESDRPWEFRQLGSGSTAALELVSLGTSGTTPQNKNFIINTITSGKVGVGTTSPGYKLHVNGSVDGVGAYNNLSDRRFKKDIRSLTNALEKLTRLQGVSFDWRREEHPEMQFEEGRQIGFIAQDLQRVVPEAVSESNDGTLHAAYSEIIPILVEAVKEQNEKLERENAELKARVETLEQLVHSLNR